MKKSNKNSVSDWFSMDTQVSFTLFKRTLSNEPHFILLFISNSTRMFRNDFIAHCRRLCNNNNNNANVQRIGTNGCNLVVIFEAIYFIFIYQSWILNIWIAVSIFFFSKITVDRIDRHIVCCWHSETVKT